MTSDLDAKLAKIDADLDELVSPTTRDVYEATLPFDKKMVAAAIGKKALTGGSPGGSSPGQQIVTRVGPILATDTITNGPVLVYTPDTDEVVTALALTAVTPVDLDALKVVFGTLAVLSGTVPNPYFLNGFDNDTVLVTPLGGYWIYADPNDPLYAGYITPYGTLLVDSPAGTWQAGHSYAAGAWLVDSNGNLQHCTDPGVSGGSEPVWDVTPGDTTTDGGVEWTNEGFAPTTGQAVVLVQSAIPTT